VVILAGEQAISPFTFQEVWDTRCPSKSKRITGPVGAGVGVLPLGGFRLSGDRGVLLVLLKARCPKWQLSGSVALFVGVVSFSTSLLFVQDNRITINTRGVTLIVSPLEWFLLFQVYRNSYLPAVCRQVMQIDNGNNPFRSAEE
jgi:hypothetical protein